MYVDRKLQCKNVKLFVTLIFLSLIIICYYLDQTIPTSQPQPVFKDVLKFKTKISGEPPSSMVGSVRAGISLYNFTSNVKPLPAQPPSSINRMEQFVIPPEVYDKKSPFYGMVYKDLYGLPMAAITNESFDEEVTESWTHYFPSLMSAIENDNKLNPTHDPTNFTTSGVITLSKTNYTLNDEFEATITSLDGKGQKKTFGGDYYRARLVRGDGRYPDGIPCKVIDNSNGTYTVKAPLVLEGSLTLDVKLVLTLQTIKRLINHTSFLCSNTTKFYSKLESNETVRCALSLNCLENQPSLCDYSTSWNKFKWICVKPPSGSCSKIVNGFNKQPKDEERKRWESNFMMKNNFYPIDFKISNTRIDVTIPKAHRSAYNQLLPNCIELFAMSKSNALPSVTGYFAENKWKSLVCQSNVTNYSFQRIQTCLQNKILYFIGDSTTRQFFHYSVTKLFLNNIGPDAAITVWQQPRVAFDENNLTMYFRTHGQPLENPGPPYIRPFVSDTISTMVGGNNVFVVFNIGTHFWDINPKTFMHKLKYIRNAINKHHQKFPDTKFIIKGMNVVEPASSWDWPLFRYDVILKQYFRNMNNVLFVDMRDLTTVWPLIKNVHPPDEILHQEYMLLLSFICL